MTLPMDVPRPGAEMRHVIGSASPAQRAPADVAYRWEFGTDRLTWGPTAAKVLRAASLPTTGLQFAAHLVPESLCSRERAIADSARDAAESGGIYRASYGLILDDAERDAPVVWIDDDGRWSPGADGAPGFAEGRMRVRAERPGVVGAVAHLPAVTRSAFLDHIDRKLAVLGRKPVPFAILAVDCPNDGPNAFAAVAATLHAQMRTRDVLGQLAADRLAILLEACDADQMRTAAARFRAALTTGRAAPTIAVSGVLAPRDGRTAAVLVTRAESVLGASDARRAGGFVAWQAPAAREDKARP